VSFFGNFGIKTRCLKTLLVVGILSCGSLAVGPLSVRADSGPMRLGPDDAVELAIRNNLGLESTRISTSMARRASDLAWNQFVPTVDVGGAILRLNSPPSVTMPIADPGTGMVTQVPIPGMRDPFPQWLISGSLSVSLSLNLAMIQDMNRLRMEYERGMISYGNARAQLERDIRKLYHNVLLLQENIALLYGSLENMDRQVQIAQANFNAGLAPELMLLQARVARDNMRPMIDQAEGGLRLMMMQFAMFLGLPHDTDFELAPVATDMSPIPLDTAELIRRAAAGQPDVLALQQDIRIMNSLRRSSNLRLSTPTLTLGWNADPTFAGNPMADSSWFDGIGSGDNWNQQSGAFMVSLGMRLNGFLPFGSERQGIRALDDHIRLANIGLAQMIRGTEIQVHNLVQTLTQIKLTMDALEQTVVLAERSFQLTEQAYRAGLVDLFQVQNAEMSLRQARVQLHEQQFNYLNGLLDLEYALGVPFGSLSVPGNPYRSLP